MPNETNDVLILEDCQLEWNRRSGVLYVHNKKTGATVVRIAGLPVARNSVMLEYGQMIDILAQLSSVPVDVLTFVVPEEMEDNEFLTRLVEAARKEVEGKS